MRSIAMLTSFLAAFQAAAQEPPVSPQESPASPAAPAVSPEPPARAGATPAVAKPPATAKPGPFLVHANFGVNVYTYLGASGSAKEAYFTPGSKAVLLQQVGFCYFVQPQIRLALTLQMAETVSGIDTSKVSPITTFGIIPWIAWTPPSGFFVGAGPLLAPRSYGKWSGDVGLFTAAGFAFKLGHGFSLGVAVQVPIMFLQRLSVAVTPAVMLAYRF